MPRPVAAERRGRKGALGDAGLFLPFVFQAEPAPSAERIHEVAQSAVRMFLAAYGAK